MTKRVIPILLAVFSWVAVSRIAFCADSEQVNPLLSKYVEVHSTTDSYLFSWVHRGKVIFGSFGHMNGGDYLYRYASGELVLVDRNEAGCSGVICEELDTLERAQVFVADQLPAVLLSFLDNRAPYIIDEHYIDTLIAQRPSVFASAYEADRFSKTIEICRRYVSSGIACRNEGKWSLRMNITFQDGSVERWELSGNVFPFRISDFKRSRLEAPGAIEPLNAPG